MRFNKPTRSAPVFTYEGSPAQRGLTPYQELRRMCLAALLFEDTFYEKGSTQGDVIAGLVKKCAPEKVSALAVECRNSMYLRHMPLYLIRELARTKGNGRLVASALEEVIQRPDELCEYLAIYWRGQADSDKSPLSAGSKRGLAAAFRKFDEATLAKYDRDHEYKLRDVLRLTHAKPMSQDRSTVWKKVIKRELEVPDTWEVALSAGENKRAAWKRLLKEKKLGGLAFLRNLRNMAQAGVDEDLIRERFAGGFKKVLPFRFVAALRFAPNYIKELNAAMMKVLAEHPGLSGTTGILVDVSGSMDDPLSAQSDMRRVDVAAGLAVLVSAVCERSRLWTFSYKTIEVPSEPSLTLVKAINDSQQHGGTHLTEAVQTIQNLRLDRVIIITDEQSGSRQAVGKPPNGAKGYVINVGTFKNGISYSDWTHIDGWSERVLDFIIEAEAEDKRNDR